jgi:Spy/CpxP family protein refolding chaperone
MLAVLGLLSFASNAMAQEQGQGGGQGQGQGGGRGGRGGFSPEAQLDRMSKELNLTDDQKTKIKPILEDGRKQMEALRDDTASSRDDKIAKMQEIRKGQDEKIKAVLTDEQKKKFDEMRKQGPGGRRGEGHEGHEGGDQPKG